MPSWTTTSRRSTLQQVGADHSVPLSVPPAYWPQPCQLLAHAALNFYHYNTLAHSTFTTITLLPIGSNATAAATAASNTAAAAATAGSTHCCCYYCRVNTSLLLVLLLLLLPGEHTAATAAAAPWGCGCMAARPH